jgi:5-methylcytosine-specific restriction protein B
VDRESALDLQILQKILPRLHGSRRRLEPTLVALSHFCFDFTAVVAAPGSPQRMPFDPLSISPVDAKLPRSFAKLARMTKGLRANQFTSFTE